MQHHSLDLPESQQHAARCMRRVVTHAWHAKATRPDSMSSRPKHACMRRHNKVVLAACPPPETNLTTIHAAWPKRCSAHAQHETSCQLRPAQNSPGYCTTACICATRPPSKGQPLQVTTVPACTCAPENVHYQPYSFALGPRATACEPHNVPRASLSWPGHTHRPCGLAKPR